jgi:hypothetical protein
MHRVFLPVFLSAVILVAGCRKISQNAQMPAGDKTIGFVATGSVQTLMADNYMGMRYFPDECLTLLHGNSQYAFRAFMAGPGVSYRLQGASAANVTDSIIVLSPGAAGTFDNGYAGISGGYYHTDGKFYAIYHAEDHEGMSNLPGTQIPGFYASVGLAVFSTDASTSPVKQGAIITSHLTKSQPYYQGQEDMGCGEPDDLMEQSGKYLYTYYTDHSREGGRGVQICMARSDISAGAPLPGTWSKYYDGGFTEAGLGGRDTPVMSGLGIDGSDAMEPFVDFSPYINKYIMIFGLDDWNEWLNITNPVADKCGIYIAYSDDGINWSQPTQVIKDFPTVVSGKSISWHAMVIWDDAQHKEGLMIWGYSPSWGDGTNGTSPHYMVGQRVKLEMI